MDISIIIASYNRKDFLKDCLLSLFNQTYPKNKYEIIVVDDGSIDGTKEMIGEIKSEVNLYYFYQRNKGKPTALNLGLKKAKGKILAFTDDDCVASQNWLIEIVKGFRKNLEIVGIGGEIIAFNPQNLIGKYWDTFFLDQKEAIEDRKNNLPHLIGANCAYKAEAFKKVGLFDPSLKIAHDIDLSWRVHFLGYQFLYLPRAIVFHRMPKTFWQLLKRKFIYGRNYYDVLYKHQKTLKKKNNFDFSIKIRDLLINDLLILLSWPFKIIVAYKQLPVQYKSEKNIYLLLPFFNSLDYRSFRLGLLYQAFKIKMRKKWISQ